MDLYKPYGYLPVLCETDVNRPGRLCLDCTFESQASIQTYTRKAPDTIVPFARAHQSFISMSYATFSIWACYHRLPLRTTPEYA